MSKKCKYLEHNVIGVLIVLKTSFPVKEKYSPSVMKPDYT